ncbi:MBL fold metallo-hydrolase [Nannocystaceae bacterium ST9]
MKRPAFALLALALTGCVVTRHATESSPIGTPSSSNAMIALLDQPGPVTLETIDSADWEVDRKGLINLRHPSAKAAGIRKGPEPIQVFFHVLRHPSEGTFLIDTGVELALRDDPNQAAVRGAVASFMKLEAMKFVMPLGEWIAAHEGEPIAGVFLTHLHLDHVTGMADVPAGTPVYSGPGEASDKAFLHAFVRRSTDRSLAGKPALREWAFQGDPEGRFAGVLDVFGDGSVWALWVPGHTPGSTAFLVRTPEGPVLITGDASHTRWGWEHDVEPGKFSADIPTSATSLARLRALVHEHPAIEVRLGHQR